MPNYTEPPFNQVITIAGMPIHTSWFGATAWSPSRRIGLTGDAGGPYTVAPPGAATLDQVVSKMILEKWECWGGNALDFEALNPFPFFDAQMSQPPPGGHIKQFHALAYLTNAYVGNMDPFFSDNRIYGVFKSSFAEQQKLADVLRGSLFSNGSEQNSLVVAIDGSGSYGHYQTALNFLGSLVDLGGAPNCKLIVTLFSDYPNYGGASSDQPAVLVGAWDGITAGTLSAATAALGSAYSGNGGDTPESGLEGILLGMQQAAGRTGRHNHVVVYTDTPMVIPFGEAILALGRLKVRVSENESSPSEWKFASPRAGENNGRGRLKVKRKHGWVNASGTTYD